MAYLRLLLPQLNMDTFVALFRLCGKNIVAHCLCVRTTGGQLPLFCVTHRRNMRAAVRTRHLPRHLRFGGCLTLHASALPFRKYATQRTIAQAPHSALVRRGPHMTLPASCLCCSQLAAQATHAHPGRVAGGNATDAAFHPHPSTSGDSAPSRTSRLRRSPPFPSCCRLRTRRHGAPVLYFSAGSQPTFASRLGGAEHRASRRALRDHAG